MQSLCARNYLLTTHEGVVGMGNGWLARGKVCVEGASARRVVRENVEVSVVFVEDYAAEGFFVRRAIKVTC